MLSITPSFNRRTLISCALLAFFAAPSQSAVAGDDNFDGAVWRFEMTNRKDTGKKLIGRFRVSNHVLFQKDTPSDPKFSKRVGTNHPSGKKTRFEVRDFRVFTAEDKKQMRMQGTARLLLVKFGEWEGQFTDQSGVNWDFHAFRILE